MIRVTKEVENAPVRQTWVEPEVTTLQIADTESRPGRVGRDASPFVDCKLS